MDTIFDITLYNDDFFKWHYEHARGYSIETMNWYIDEYKPSSVCDIGCGIGSYLEAAYQKGIRNLQGFDIAADAARRYTPLKIQPFIDYRDCGKPLALPPEHGGFECVICFETAEHIEPSDSLVFVQNICAVLHEKGTILFTGAPPGQEGCGHINCQPRDYWINLFIQCGMLSNPYREKNIATNWQRIGCPNYITESLIVLHNKP